VSAARQIISLYERHARTWLSLRQRAPLFERSWLDRFVSLLPLSDARVLDIGCGGGDPIASYLVEKGSAVTGVDSSATMIGICRKRHPRHTWIEADMRTLDLDRRFDGLLAWDSFFHLSADDQRKMFPIFTRHAAPGAALMFTSGPRDGEALGSLEGEVLYHASLAPEEYRSLLTENGFEVKEFVVEDSDCAGHTVWLCRAEARADLGRDS
jgi:2-polyprenyl-3-methyl-5-hydroxy-6-metoxy-1,4-benzoquinol methylase